MLRYCPCGKILRNRAFINGRTVNTQRRKYCFECSPFGNGNGEKKCRPNRHIKRPLPPQSRQREFRRERKRKLVEMLGGKCNRCGYDKCHRALELHHLSRANKQFAISGKGYTSKWSVLVEEARKCRVLCANCHREIEDEIENSGYSSNGRAAL